MILRSYPHRNIYGKYFLAVEAPGDEEVTEENKPRRNIKVVSVKPDNRKRKDFTDVGGDEEQQEQTQEENMPVVSDDGPDTGGDEDFASDEPEATNVPDEGNGDENVEVNQPNEDPPTTTDEGNAPDAGDENENGDTGPDTGGDDDFTDTGEEAPAADDATGDEAGDDSPDTGGDHDFTDTGDSGSDGEADTSTDAGESSGEKGKPGIEYDSTRKYMLYLEFISLYNSCENYISKLETIIKDDIDENRAIQKCSNTLREIRNLLYDYMTIRFTSDSYVQSLLFYQKMIVSVQLVFKQIKVVRELKHGKK